MRRFRIEDYTLDLRTASEAQIDKLALAAFIVYELDIDGFDEILQLSTAEALQELGLSYSDFRQFKRGWLALRDLIGHPKPVEQLEG